MGKVKEKMLEMRLWCSAHHNKGKKKGNLRSGCGRLLLIGILVFLIAFGITLILRLHKEVREWEIYDDMNRYNTFCMML